MLGASQDALAELSGNGTGVEGVELGRAANVRQVSVGGWGSTWQCGI